MSQPNVTDVLSEIGLAAAALHKLVQMPLEDAIDVAPLEALIGKIGLLAGVGMGLADPVHKDRADEGTAMAWFLGSREG